MRSWTGRADRVGGRREDRRRRHPLAVDLRDVAEPGEREQRAAVDAVVERHARLALLLRSQPLVPAVGDHEAAPLRALEQAREDLLLRHRLRARVDQQGPLPHLLGPRRHEAPAHRARALVGDDEDVLGRADVEAAERGRLERDLAELEALVDEPRPDLGECVAPAHGASQTIGGREARERGRDRVHRHQALALELEAHLDRAVAGAARLVAGGEARVGERDLVALLARDLQPQARRRRVGPEVLLALEEERAPAAHAGGGRLRPADQHAQRLGAGRRSRSPPARSPGCASGRRPRCATPSGRS